MSDSNSNQQNQGSHRETVDSENFGLNAGQDSAENPPDFYKRESVEPGRESRTREDFSPEVAREMEPQLENQAEKESAGSSGQVQTKQAKLSDEEDSELKEIAQMEKDQQVDVLVKMALTRNQAKAVKMAKKIFKDSPHYLDKFHDDLSLRKKA